MQTHVAQIKGADERVGQIGKKHMVPSVSPRDEAKRLLRIVIPAKNEEARIAASVTAYCEHFGETATVLVVANACTDRTTDIVKSLSLRFPNLQLLEIAVPIGKGGAVRAGLKIGSEPYVAFVDADGSARPDQLALLFDACRQNEVSGAIGSRWLPASTIARKQPLQRRVASRIFNLLVRLLFGLPFSDTQCGVKIFERSAINEVLETLELANFAFDVDLLVALKRLRLPIIEVPITWDDVPDYSKVTVLRAGSSMFWALVRLWVRDSLLGRLPWADLVGRSCTIPVKRGLKFLLLTSRRPYTAHEQRLLDEIVIRGHEITAQPIVGPLTTMRFLWNYGRYGHRRYDVILDFVGYHGSILSSLSTKPKLYRSSLESLEVDEVGTLVDLSARRCGYSAFFWRYDEGWTLSASQADTALRVETRLHETL